MKEFLANFVNFIQAYGIIGLMVLSFVESSFFPIPPDVLLIPMAFMNRKLAIFYALATTVASVLGGIFGHILGRKLGKPILKRLFKEETINRVEKYFERYGGWSLAVAGFTPIPYKIFTISAGVFNVRIAILIIASIIGRGARFFLEGFIILFMGDTAKYYLQNYFEVITIGLTVLCVAVYLVWKKLKFLGKIRNMGIMMFFKRKYDSICKIISKNKKYDEAVVYFIAGICLSLLSLFILLDLVEDYLTRGNWQFDLIAQTYVNSIRNETLTRIFRTITFTGNAGSIIAATLIISSVLIYIKKKDEAILFSLNILGVWLFNELLKYIFKRPRPSVEWLASASGYSFPSGHTMISMGFGLLLMYYILNLIKNKKLSITISILIFLYSILIGLSRVYLGVHYLSDVFAGWVAGTLWISSMIVVYRTLHYRKIL